MQFSRLLMNTSGALLEDYCGTGRIRSNRDHRGSSAGDIFMLARIDRALLCCFENTRFDSADTTRTYARPIRVNFGVGLWLWGGSRVAVGCELKLEI